MAKICPLWFVSQLGIAEDGNKPRPELNQPLRMQADDGAIQPAQPRNRARVPGGNAFELAAEGQQSNGYGFHMQRTNVITLAFTTEEAAKEYAKTQAAKNPQTTYGIFGCVGVVETTVPTLIEKQFNASGELILLEKANGGAADASL